MTLSLSYLQVLLGRLRPGPRVEGDETDGLQMERETINCTSRLDGCYATFSRGIMGLKLPEDHLHGHLRSRPEAV